MSAALPTWHEQDLAPAWQLAAAPDGDDEQWDKHQSRAMWVAEIPPGFDPILAPIGSGGSDSSAHPDPVGKQEDVSPTTHCAAGVKHCLVLPAVCQEAAPLEYD